MTTNPRSEHFDRGFDAGYASGLADAYRPPAVLTPELVAAIPDATGLALERARAMGLFVQLSGSQSGWTMGVEVSGEWGTTFGEGPTPLAAITEAMRQVEDRT